MKNEADVKKEVKKVLKALGAWWYMPVPMGYGKQGVPDFIVCLKGLFIAIETKYGGNTPTPHQRIQLEQVEDAGGLSLVIDENNVSHLSPWLMSWVLDRDPDLT